VVDGKKREDSKYANPVVDMQQDGKPLFPRSIEDVSTMPGAVSLYRRLLADSPDSSVVIITVGVSTNIARLLSSGPDEYSPLGGLELVSRKVEYLSMMAGNFVKSLPEANVFNDSAAAAVVFRDWPTRIMISPFDVGLALKYPAESILNDFGYVELHPLVEAYKAYLPMPYDRPTWDLTSVLYSAEKDSGYFAISPPGKVSLGYEPDHPRHVVTHFTPDPSGMHYYFSLEDNQAERVMERLVELVTMDPLHE
jgi:inosine-uridine nucleoside N-ribohydrolase